MKAKDLPERWIDQLERYTDDKYGRNYGNRGKLGAADFPVDSVIRLRFPDGSEAEFRHAFYLAEPEYNEIAVFTEHCGYHLFPLVDLEVECLDANQGSYDGEQ